MHFKIEGTNHSRTGHNLSQCPTLVILKVEELYLNQIKFRRARTLYPCEADNPSELSFEANVIISNGK